MKQITKTMLTTLAALLMVCGMSWQQAQAAQISGNITIAGGLTLNSSLATATKATSFSNTDVISRSGGFVGLVNVLDSVTMAPTWIFNPSTATPGLWSVDGFTFDLTSSTIVTQNSSFLTITGVGTVSGNGYSSTPATWSFSTQSPPANCQYSFSAATGAVPDGGSTLALCGIALIGLAAVRRMVAS